MRLFITIMLLTASFVGGWQLRDLTAQRDVLNIQANYTNQLAAAQQQARQREQHLQQKMQEIQHETQQQLAEISAFERAAADHRVREFIYKQIGYDPNTTLPQQWKHFHDRVSLTYNRVPAGNFSIFKEIADMIVTLGQAGLYIDDAFVPNISVGQYGARHWTNINSDSMYGERIKYLHDYPHYFLS